MIGVEKERELCPLCSGRGDNRILLESVWCQDVGGIAARAENRAGCAKKVAA